MSRYLIIADGDIEEKVAVALWKEIKSYAPRKAVLFLSLTVPGDLRRRGLPEIRWQNSYCGTSFWWSLAKTLWRRRGWREELFFIGRRTGMLFFLFLFTGKKAFFLRVVEEEKVSLSSWQRFLMRYFARTIFSNDFELVTRLRRNNIPVYFTKNILADLILPGDLSFASGGRPVVALFPRTLQDKHDVSFLEEAAEEIASRMSAYFLLVVPKGTRVQDLRNIGEKDGWHWHRSLEGEIMEGYLLKGKNYLNVTSFYQEAMKQADFVVSFEFLRVIQAAGFGKKVIPIFQLSPKEVAALLGNPAYLFEYNLFLSYRFGEGGGIKTVAFFLLSGVVEDQRWKIKGV